MKPRWDSLSIEEQVAELHAVCVGLYDMIEEDVATIRTDIRAEIERLRDADAQMQREIQELRTALAAHLPSLAAHLPVPGAHHPVPGARPSEPEREREQRTTNDAG